MKTINLIALETIPFVEPGDDVGMIICEATARERFTFADGDIVIVASKIVSKAEGRLVDTDAVKPSRQAQALSKRVDVPAKQLEVILRETKRVLIARPGLLLTEHRLGFICTKAGVDSSNTVAGPKGRVVALLPKDPDASARRIRSKIKRNFGKKVAVIVNDTFGRSDRKGSVGMAIGMAGLPVVYVPKSKKDLHGKRRHPEISHVDEIAAAGSLFMGQTSERRPVIILRGLDFRPTEKGHIQDVLQPTEKYIQDAVDVVKLLRQRSH